MAGIWMIILQHTSRILGITLGTVFFWQLLLAGYNLFLHPLRKFPGPVLQRASPLVWAWQHASGHQAFRTQQHHDRYGPIVRIGPNHLTFTNVNAWKEIYGFQVGKELDDNELPKARLFSTTVESLPRSIVNADREEHQRFRRALSHGFSDSSMRAQEVIIAKYIDKLILRLHEASDGKDAAAVNMEAWYNWTTFDIAGDLIFGQSFDCLEKSNYHPWIAFILRSIRINAFTTALKYIGLKPLLQRLYTMGGLAAMSRLRQCIDEMMRARLSMENNRKDLFEGMLKKKEEWNLSFDTLSANGLILVLAGSETTATTLAGTTYLLASHPEVMKRLNEEVRSAFTNSSEITINSVCKLPYMLAVLNEALRLYPPVTSGLIREVPEPGYRIASEHIPKGTLVEVQQWSVNHSPDNWTRPWEFRPERFLEDGEGEHNHLDALQPFSVGPRNCIGKNLAYAEMRLVLARIVYDFDMKLAEGNGPWIERQRVFGLWDRIPLMVNLKPVGLKRTT
ncbi:isotrichodermin c-15 hydroxylase [Colletotrichum incanum]|uniref:Isotrichodermin c-15 hydroxylase n=1 Tax=Colletotrichum incanum TaxID=1573173 RepID=A0A167ANY5_COLIC|nr:isotrichodermin c-15 hydroxylase [Colletotrichum incanum]OHW93404.1 isotrichodermin c-15 hydroxylase [Colletotrichum incanum]